LVTKEVAKAKKPVVAAKYHSFAQTCDKRIVSCYSKQGSNLESYSHWQLLLYPRSIILALLSSSHNLKNSVGIVKWKNERLNQGNADKLKSSRFCKLYRYETDTTKFFRRWPYVISCPPGLDCRLYISN